MSGPCDLAAALKEAPTWQEGDGQVRFWNLAPFSGGHVWVGRWSGESPWERHPDSDEMLHLLEGEVDVTLLLHDGPVTTRVGAGSVFVVPQNTWHRQRSAAPVLQMGVTPGRTDHSDAADPRASA